MLKKYITHFQTYVHIYDHSYHYLIYDLSLPVATESRLLPSETSMINVDELHGPEKSGSLDTADISIIEDTGEGKFFDWYRHTSN